jgi:two-component system nitrate/nitrite response regulator NarL
MPKRILVVDDSASVLNSIKFMLESVPDWAVVGEACNGREGIDQVALVNPDLVLLDLSMPVMNGLDAARELSRTKPDLPVVMFTDTPEIARDALICGCRAVVSKTQVLLLIELIHEIFAKQAA